jgi:hypothetical protein
MEGGKRPSRQRTVATRNPTRSKALESSPHPRGCRRTAGGQRSRRRDAALRRRVLEGCGAMRRQSAVAVSRPVCTGPCAGGSGSSEALELKGKVTAVLARQLAVGWRPGTPETHRTPGPESGCNKPEDLDHAVRRSGEEPHGRHHSHGWQPWPNDEALGRSREKWSVPRVRRWRGTLGNARRGGLAKVSPASSAAPRRRRQGHGGRRPTSSRDWEQLQRESPEGRVR